MLMLPAFPSEPQGQGLSGMMIEALPMWQEADELGDHRQYIFHYHTIMCPQFANGYCPRHKGSRSAPPQCFCYHFESQRRRPLVDTLTGQLRYWDVLCEHMAEGEECPCGDLCPFAHTREEISYHAAKYKTKFCNDRDCRGKEVCCFAHGESELRAHALERYSYWSSWPGGAQGPRPGLPVHDLAFAAGAGAAGGRGGATGALYHPKVYKHRFCASYPHVAGCRRGDACAFAHSREEIRTPLLAGEEEDQRPSALTNDFFMYRFKTLWCPVGVQHDWQTCVYAHNYQDARRHPGTGYGPRPCPYWKRKETALEYSQRCPLGVRCPFSHGAKEQLYHPSYFKTVTCQDWPNSNCPRGKLCAFWHKRSQQRARPSSEDEFNYKLPIPEDRLEGALQPDFLSPPFKLLSAAQAEAGPEEPGGMGVPETCHQPALGVWAPPLCRFNSGGTSATPTTIADCDEAASADSSSGSDKIPAAPEDEDGAGGAPQAAPQAGAPWALAQWPGEGMAMPGFGQPLGGQVMCYVRVQPAGGSHQPSDHSGGQVVCGAITGDQVLQQPSTFAHSAGCPNEPGCPQFGMPLLPGDAVALPGEYFPNRPFTHPGGAEVVMPPPMPAWYGDGSAYGFLPTLAACGGEFLAGPVALPGAGEPWCAAGAPPGAAGAAGGAGPGGAAAGAGAWAPEAAMPTYKGFIHFRDSDGADPEAPPAGRRPRASSH